MPTGMPIAIVMALPTAWCMPMAMSMSVLSHMAIGTPMGMPIAVVIALGSAMGITMASLRHTLHEPHTRWDAHGYWCDSAMPTFMRMAMSRAFATAVGMPMAMDMFPPSHTL